MIDLNIVVRGNGPPLVFFHGWGFDHEIWLPLANHIDKRYQLFLVDLPGFGLSLPMSWDDYKRNLLNYLPAHFALAGWSMGGLFATRLAIEEPQLVTHLINIASSPRFIKEKNWPGISKRVFDHFFVNLVTNPQLAITQFVSLQSKNQICPHRDGRMPDPESLKEGLHLLTNWDLREPLRFFTKPTCFMFGRLDAIIPRTTMTAMQKSYPHFTYVLFDKAAHMPFISHQDAFIAALEQMI